MSWAPRDLEEELFDDISSLTLQENPSYFKTVTEVNIPVIIKKLDEVREPSNNKPNGAASEVLLSTTQTLRMHGIESYHGIPKSSPLSDCISKNDFSDPRFPLILEDKYFTMKSEHHPCTSNQANKTRALPKKSVCDQQVMLTDETWGKTVKEAQEDERQISPKPCEDIAWPVVSNCPINKPVKSLIKKKKTKMKKIDFAPQEEPQKVNRMAPPGVRGISYI